MKYIGIVDWFHDKARDAEYGFIKNEELGDIYVNKAGLSPEMETLKQGDVVVFNKKVSKQNPEKIKAINVHIIENEYDILFLIKNYFNYYHLSTNKIALNLKKILSEKIGNISEEKIEPIIDYILKIVVQKIRFIKSSTNRDIIEEYQELFNSTKLIVENYFDIIINRLEQNLDPEVKLYLWLLSFYKSISIEIILNLFLRQQYFIQEKILEKFNQDDKFKIISGIIETLDSIDDDKYDSLISLLDLSREYIKHYYPRILKLCIEKCSLKHRFNLWLDDYGHDYENDFTIHIINNFSNFEEEKKKEILSKCPQNEQNKIILNLIEKIDKIVDDISFNKALALLNLCKAVSIPNYSDLSALIVKNSHPKYQLIYWLQNNTEYYDFHSFKFHLLSVTPEQQRLFLKKTFMLIHSGQINLTIKDIAELNNEIILEKSNNLYHFDYSTSILIQTLIDLNEKRITNREKIYEIIVRLIKDPDELLKIEGFFDKCEGRKIIRNIDEKKDRNGNIVEIKFDSERINKPVFIEYCEGRKAERNGNYILDNRVKKPFWWCGNQKCYEPSRKFHKVDEWKDYTLIDFLKILRIPYNTNQYEILIGLINKVNQFLDHLKCRECGHILSPSHQSNYAFYRVNSFKCINPECSVCKDGLEIYITHCINGRCNNVIDSRDSEKCLPHGFENENSGWYVCNYCYACCTTEKINFRKKIIEKTGQSYKGHNVGHKDLNEICCYKCGNLMKKMNRNETEYKRILNWFIKNRNNKKWISKYGKRNDGKWWFLINKPDNYDYDEFKIKLDKYKKLGFQIPNINEFKNYQLIGESYSELGNYTYRYECTNCDNYIDILELKEKNDFEKLRAIKFHPSINEIFDK